MIVPSEIHLFKWYIVKIARRILHLSYHSVRSDVEPFNETYNFCTVTSAKKSNSIASTHIFNKIS